MLGPWSWARGVGAGLLMVMLSTLPYAQAFQAELSELFGTNESIADGVYDRLEEFDLTELDGVDPLETECEGRRCMSVLTRDGSLALDSMYSCTQPLLEDSDICGVTYWFADFFDPATIAGMKIAFHPESTTSVQLIIEGVSVLDWEGIAGTSELQDVPGAAGIEASSIKVQGQLAGGDYFGLLEVEIYLEVEEIEILGVSASTRDTVSVTSATDGTSATKTLDGDISDASSWTCSLGDECEITYDFGTVESLEQLRIAFGSGTSAGGELIVTAAGDSGMFSAVATITEAGERPAASDGLQTYGGVRALARYVKIRAVPASGGMISFNEVEFQVGEDAPIRPVAAQASLDPAGDLPMGSHAGSSFDPNSDLRAPSSGGCDSPGHLEGCDIFYIKDGDTSDDSRWSCGPLASGSRESGNGCEVTFSLNTYKHVKQIQLAFHLGDEQHDEFSIQAWTVDDEWETVVPSAITAGDTTDYQTFDVNVHTNILRFNPKFQRMNQWINIKEMIILERRKENVLSRTVPVFGFSVRRASDDDGTTETTGATNKFKFRLFAPGDYASVDTALGTVSAVQMKFPKYRQFTFDVEYFTRTDDSEQEYIERFTSAGGERMWETFSLPEPIEIRFLLITAVEGPADVPSGYPTLKVGDFRVVGDTTESPAGTFQMVTTTMAQWGTIPDIIGYGVAEQQTIMTVICETKGATFDGTDCDGALDESSVYIELGRGITYVDGPIFMKAGVTISGSTSDDAPAHSFINLYDGANAANTNEEAIIVFDGVVGAEVEDLYLEHKTTPSGDVILGTVGNLGVEVKNSQDITLNGLEIHTYREGGVHFSDSNSVRVSAMYTRESFEGNFMELSNVQDFYMRAFPTMEGVLIDGCTNTTFEGIEYSDFEPDGILDPPVSGEQTANVVITGGSSEVSIKTCEIGLGPEPRILMESAGPLTLDNIFEYSSATSGDCIVQVPEGAADDTVVQLNTNDGQTLSRVGNCYVFD